VDTALRWLARGEDALPAGSDWLSAGEGAAAASMRFTKRRQEFLLRRLVAKHAVAVSIGGDTDALTLAGIEVRNRPSGAPYIVINGTPSHLGVSISDRAGWAVCLVGPDVDGLGCDLELVEPRTDAFVRDFLTDAEQRYVFACPAGEARHAAANLIWSAKESALKVLGTGLRRDTRSVEVTLAAAPGAAGAAGGGWAELSVRAVEGTVFPGWWRRDGRFLFTVAARAGRSRPPTGLEPSNALASAEPRHSWLASPRWTA